jgi:hypothetical protein
MNQPDKYVAILDILGFKKIVETTPPEKILTAYKDIEMVVRSNLQIERKFSTIMNQLAKEKKQPNADYIAPISDLDCRIFSDTIVIFSKSNIGDSMYNSADICKTLIKVFNLALHKHSWLLRGALARGSIFVDGNIIFGDALVRAYKCEQDQNWAGIVALDKADIMFNQYNPYTCDYMVPFKSGRAEATVLNFFVEDRMPIPFSELTEKLSGMMRGQSDPDAITKIKNTLALFQYLTKRNVSVSSWFESVTINELEEENPLAPHLGPLNEVLKAALKLRDLDRKPTSKKRRRKR